MLTGHSSSPFHHHHNDGDGDGNSSKNIRLGRGEGGGGGGSSSQEVADPVIWFTPPPAEKLLLQQQWVGAPGSGKNGNTEEIINLLATGDKRRAAATAAGTRRMDHDHASNSISVSVNAAAAAAAAESNISSSGNSSPNLWRSRIGNTMDAATGSTSTGIATTTSGSLMQPPVYSNNPSLLTPLEKKQRRTNDYQSFYANTQKKHRAHQAPDANNLQDIFKQLNDAITNSKISPMNNHGLNNVMNSSSSSSPAHASPHDTPLPINKPHHHKHFFINNQNNIPPFSDDNHMLLSTDPVIMEDVDSSIVKETQLELLNLNQKTPPPLPTTPKPYTRFLVLEVNNEYDKRGFLCKKSLRLLDETILSENVAELIDSWTDTKVHIGDYINIVGEFDIKHTIVVDKDSNFVVTYPDLLIPVTTLSESFACSRRAVLNNRIKPAQKEKGDALVYGTMLHLIFQKCLKARTFERAFIIEEIEGVIASSEEDIYLIGRGVDQVRDFLIPHVATLQAWARAYLDPAYLVVNSRDLNVKSKGKCDIYITDVLGLEERFWSPMFGLKGNADACVAFSDPNIRNSGNNNNNNSRIIGPLEIKTGKVSTEGSHRAQTTLYSLLMKDHYQQDIPVGLLHYLTAGQLTPIHNRRIEMLNLILSRNDLAHSMQDDFNLPQVKRKSDMCSRCFVRVPCSIYHKAFEDGNTESFGIGVNFDDVTRHLTPVHCDFLRKWDGMIAMEEGDITRFKKEMWTLSAKEREVFGRCLSEMHIVEMIVNSENFYGTSNVTYTFRRCKWSTCNSDFLNSENQIGVGDPIVISPQQGGPMALAVGFVMKLTSSYLVINADCAMDKSRYHPTCDLKDICVDQTLFRIDKDELQAGMGKIRHNLLSMFLGGDNSLRELVVELRAPRFTVKDYSEIFANLKGLNPDQKNAIKKVLSAEDYALILGMPGTGKTTTITQLINVLASQGKTVLLTSYTHTAVDNVLFKLKETGTEFLRIGNMDKIDERLRAYHPDNVRAAKKIDSIETLYSSAKIVATTCLSIGHSIFAKNRLFDYCIIDEASQLTLPVSLGPLRFARKFILVGDHYQLPPLVKNQQARESGFSLSLFKRLSEAHPDAVIHLEHQYRMNADIMSLSNEFVYSQRLRCGNDHVAKLKLDLPRLDAALSSIHSSAAASCGGQACWIRHILSPENNVVFLDTDRLPNATEFKTGNKIQNIMEAKLVYQAVEVMAQAGLPGDSIGIISPYRAQLQIIGAMLKQSHKSVECSTIDKYQGRDKECIIISLVRSNSNQNVGELLKDWRRTNVAFTRSKRKLIIIGSMRTLSGAMLFSDLFNFLLSRNWVYSLKEDDDVRHKIEPPPPADRSSTPSPVDKAKQQQREKIESGRVGGILQRGLQRRYSLISDILNEERE